MIKLIKDKKWLTTTNFVKGAVLAGLTGFMLSTYAAAPAAGGVTSLAGVATNIQGVVYEGIEAVEAVAMIVGLIVLIVGIMAFKQAANDMQGTGGHHKKGVIAIILGACLLAAPLLVEILQNSLFGTATTITTGS